MIRRRIMDIILETGILLSVGDCWLNHDDCPDMDDRPCRCDCDDCNCDYYCRCDCDDCFCDGCDMCDRD